MSSPVEIKKPRRGRPPKPREEKNQPQDVSMASQSAGEKPSAAAVTEATPAAAGGKILSRIDMCGFHAALKAVEAMLVYEVQSTNLSLSV